MTKKTKHKKYRRIIKEKEDNKEETKGEKE